MYVKVQRQEISQLQYFHNSIPFKFPSSWTRKDLNALTHLHLQHLFSPDLEGDQFDSALSWIYQFDSALSKTAISLTQRCPGQLSIWFHAVPGSNQFNSAVPDRANFVEICVRIWIIRPGGIELCKHLKLENRMTLRLYTVYSNIL